MSGLRIVFFGTPEFAVPGLQALAQAPGIELAAVVTRPDRARGRGQERMEPPPVAAAARALGLPVLQPDRPSRPGFAEELAALRPDALAVVAYGHLIPDAMLSLARHGAWNVHPSLLPRWRGPAPIHRAISSGDERTGVCIIKLVTEMDAGPVAMRSEISLTTTVTRGDLEGTLAALGADLLVRTLDRVQHGFVVDWVDVGLGSLRFWTFNLGDAAIDIGILLLIVLALWPGLGGTRRDSGGTGHDA